MKRWLLIAVCCAPLTVLAAAQPPDLWQRVGFEQRLNTQLPLALEFRNEQRRRVRLADYFRDKPVILVLGYYGCKNLCSVVMDGLLASLRQLRFDAGDQYEVVMVSVNPRETPQLARMKKAVYLNTYDRPGAARGLNFLTGDARSIQKLAASAGFRYFYDRKIDQYVHAAGITVLTPRGKIARYFYGVQFQPSDVRLSLVEASMNRIGSVVDQLVLLCARYDAATGTYSYMIWNILRGACVGTALALSGFIVVAVRRDRNGKRRARGTAGQP
ncbi:MAG: SCO family protein [Gammaproteobacteria bacterium]|nr:SCO family protein [Gammaproteobacteria bacterium]